MATIFPLINSQFSFFGNEKNFVAFSFPVSAILNRKFPGLISRCEPHANFYQRVFYRQLNRIMQIGWLGGVGGRRAVIASTEPALCMNEYQFISAGLLPA